MFGDGGQPVRKPCFGLGAKLGGFGLRRIFRVRHEKRKDGLAGPWPERAALGDLDGVGRRLGQVREQCGHLGLRLQPMLGRKAAPVVLRDVAAVRDTEQRIVRLESVALRKVRLVGGHQRHVVLVGPAQELRFHQPFAGQVVPLNLDIEPAGEKTLKRLKPGLGHACVARRESPVHGAVGAAGQRDQARRVRLQLGERYVGRAVIAMLHIGEARKLHEVAVAQGILGKQDDGAMMGGWARAGPRSFLGGSRERQIQRAADDGLDARAREILGEFERAEKVVPVGDGERGRPVRLRELRKRLHRQRTLQQRVGGMHMQVDKGRRGHKLPQAKQRTLGPT